jgi:hypothetical protein
MIKLAHYGLPAFPAMALLVARLCAEVLERVPGAPSPRALLVAPLAALTAFAALSLLAWHGALFESALTSAQSARLGRGR